MQDGRGAESSRSSSPRRVPRHPTAAALPGYLRAYDGVPEARRGVGDYFAFFNDKQPYQALGYCVPSAVYFSSLAELQRQAA